MKCRWQFILKIKEKRGAVAIIAAIMINFVLIGIMALAIDVGYLFATRNQLQNIADGAALAAAGKLADQNLNGESLDAAAIIRVAQEIGENNQAGEKFGIDIRDNDVVIGRWKDPDLDPNGLYKTSDSPDAVRVTARRDGQANNSVRTFFGVIFGVNSVEMTADATAALSGPIQLASPIPVGISKYWFEKINSDLMLEDGFCGRDIKFYPTGDLEGCASWHTYTSSPANADTLKDILDKLYEDEGEFEIPEATAGVTKYEFIGGNLGEAAFGRFEDLYNKKKDSNGDWCVDVVVYDYDDCSNPKKSITIVGFAPVVITGVLTPKGSKGKENSTIQARVLCDKVVPARGGGEFFGEWAVIPRLVE